jgi:threonine/homoserine/homoserine lactone efflux protein
MSDHNSAPTIAAIIVLGIIMVTAIIGITFAAVLTNRDLKLVEGLTFLGVLFIAFLGGLIIRRTTIVGREKGEDE